MVCSTPWPEWTKMISSASALRKSSRWGCAGRQRASDTSALASRTNRARNRVSGARDGPGFHVVMAEHGLIEELVLH